MVPAFEPGPEALLVGTTGATTGVAAEPRAAVTSIPPISTRATISTTGTTRSVGPARPTPRPTATTALAAGVARCSGELPADTGSRHLSAARPVVVSWLVLLDAQLEAAEAARFVAAITAGATASAGATVSAAPAIPATATILTAAAPVVTPALRRCHAIDRIVILATRDRAVRPLLTLEHAHEADLVEPVADDIERLDESGCPVGLNPQRARDGIADRIGLLFGGRVGGRGLGRRLRRCLGLPPRGVGRCVTRRIPGGAVGCIHRIIELRGGCTYVRATRGSACSSRLAQRERRELGERFHGTLATPKASETPGLRISDRG
jgi:hypothetical protein